MLDRLAPTAAPKALESARVDPAAEAPAIARPMRVLFTSYRSHPHVGGQGVYVRELTRALADVGHEVTVISGPPYPELDPRVALEKLPSLDLFEEENPFFAFRPRFLASWPDMAEWWLHNTGAFGEPYAFGERLKRWLDVHRDRFDVVHDNQGLFTALPDLGLPTIATLHHPITIDLEFALAAEPRWWMRAFVRRWHSFLGTQADVSRKLPAIITVSEASKRRAVADFGISPDRMKVSPNGIDHDLFHERPHIARDPDLVLSTVSADTAIKGLVILIEAFAEVVAARPTAKLRIVGDLRDGPAKDAIARLAIADNIVFGGRLERTELADLYAAASVVASPSRFEGFGFPAAEAMACGAAMCVSDGGALPEVVGDAGLISPVGDAPAMAANILSLLNDPERRAALGLRAAERARTRFSWRAHALASTAAYLEASAHADR